MKPTALSPLLGLWLATHAGSAQVPQILNHQGRFTVAGINYTGAAQFKFALISTNTGSVQSLWSHDGTSVGGIEPSGSTVSLPVHRGVFAVNLGDTNLPAMLEPIPASVFVNPEVFLRVWVDDGTNGSQRLLPDRRLVATAYAFVADGFSGTLAGDVSGTQSATVVDFVGGAAAADVARAVAAALTATNASLPETVVRRDASGGFQAGTIVGSFEGDASGLTNLLAGNIVGAVSLATNFTGALSGDVIGTQTATVVAEVGGVSAAQVASGAQAANNATNINVRGLLVKRDAADASFAAGPIVATRFVGDGSGLSNLPASPAQYSAPAGAVLVSLSATDPTLIASGYRRFMSQAAPAWVNGSATDAPSARAGHTAIWDGQRVVVWGGQVGPTSYSASGGMYDPTTDPWAPTRTLGAPSARTHHTAVWTGSEMIVWGGLGSAGFLGSGARFSPGTLTWTAVTATGAPSPRSQHVALWTGNRMLVWGGRDPSGPLSDGALYDPVANQWTALTIPDAPEARMGAVAVWATDRALIWGGAGTLGELGTGGQLVFASGLPQTWLPISITNAPLARSQCTAVWTGDKMIVWGGLNQGSPLGDGGVFCTDCGTWKPVSSTNAPMARYDHAAVWSGSEMLVLSGANLGGDLASSAAYDPATWQWRSLSGVGSPLERSQLKAVWTDTEILVFGGRSSGQYVASLQRLSPQPGWHFYRKL